MPMPLPPAGGLPSPLTQGHPNAGGMTQQQGNQGNIQAALVKIKAASKMLEEALPLIPFGHDKHVKLMKIVSELAKEINEAGNNPQAEVASLQSAAQNVAKQAPMQNMARMFGASQGAGQPPAQEQPQAA
jgi:hypothetical protein